MHLNKVNLSWVLSDGRRGHEIQSMALAQTVSKQSLLFNFQLKHPWEFFAPRIMPFFKPALQWSNASSPNLLKPPDVIITAGRKAAATGKYLTQKLRAKDTLVKHIQILNPKDSVTKYDLLLIPQHDLKTGPNIINFLGSLHPFNESWFKHITSDIKFQCAVVIGNPPKAYFKHEFKAEVDAIRKRYPHHPLLFCASPRMNEDRIKCITDELHPKDQFWHLNSSGNNPYQNILRQTQHLFVTTDSINMMNESANSHAAVTLLARNFTPSKKHLRFIDSIDYRWTGFNEKHLIQKPLPYALNKISNHVKLQKLLNSPTSSNSG